MSTTTFMQFVEQRSPRGEVEYSLCCPELQDYSNRFSATGLLPQCRIVSRSGAPGFECRSSMFILGPVDVSSHDTFDAAKEHGIQWVERKLTEYRAIRDAAWRMACANGPYAAKA